eukprot:1648667-Pleurochrysis_carterae.AAC.1
MQRHKPLHNYEQRKAERFEMKQEAAIKLTAPNQSLSYYRTLSGEQNSSKFWRRIFPITRGRKGIIKINKVSDWNNPPPKNISTPPYTQKIAEEAAKYYEHLYSPQIENNQTNNAKHRLLKKLREWGVENTTSQSAGEDITTEEISKVMTFLPKGKAPGPDRIPNEFYATFANLLAPIYTKYYNHIHHNVKAPKGFTNGLISILHKKGIREDIRNYRPITLLNSDYKILTRILAHRSRALATQFVSNDQIGFVPNTFIAESTLLINMIQAHLDNVQEEGLLIFLDLEKAFDRCSWKYLRQAISALRTTKNYKDWINLLYDDNNPPQRQVISNGYLSRKFNIRQGTAQGCPLSPILFLAIVEGFTRSINNDPNITGIQIGNMTRKLGHFADDSIAFLKSLTELPLFENHLKNFCLATNMLENKDKREILPLGITATKSETLIQRHIREGKPPPTQPTGWKNRNDTVISLGIPHGNVKNFDPFLLAKYAQAKAKLASAKSIHQLPINGRHKILNSIFYGTFRYYMFSIEFPKWLNDSIEQDASHFIWKSKPLFNKDSLGTKGRTGKYINKAATNLPLTKGGAGCLNWKAHTKAFNAFWIIAYLHPREAPWKKILSHWLKPMPPDYLIHLTSKEKLEIKKRIPEGQHIIRKALEAFLEPQT